MAKASKLADKIANQPGLEKRSTLQQRVQQTGGSVGVQSSNAPQMAELVSAELINQGKLDPKKIQN